MSDAVASIPKDRSPAFPYINLELAVDRARRIYAEIRDHAQPREVVAKAYGKPVTSSATIQTFATLLQYGLLENVAAPNGRRMRVSVLAQTIFNPNAPQEKVKDATRKAALNPPIFAELWGRFGDAAGLNDNVVLYYLTTERSEEKDKGAFTDKAASDVLRVYRGTLAYAGITGSAANIQLPTETPAEDTSPLPKAKVGDLVQVEIGGVFQLPKPKRIESIQEYEGRLWVFLQGEKAAVEMENVIAQEEKPNPPKPPLRDHILEDDELAEGWSEERLIDDGGDEVKIRYRGKASLERYEFIRDYLDFKIQRLSKKSN